MIEVGISKAKAGFSEYVSRAAYGGERIIILSRGKPKAAMVSVADLRRLEELEDALAAVETDEAYTLGEHLVAGLEDILQGQVTETVTTSELEHHLDTLFSEA